MLKRLILCRFIFKLNQEHTNWKISASLTKYFYIKQIIDTLTFEMKNHTLSLQLDYKCVKDRWTGLRGYKERGTTSFNHIIDHKVTHSMTNEKK